MFSAPESSSGPLRFGRYEALFRIAAGGMAEVYAARMMGEGGFEKPVALKRMLPTLAEDERFVEMFLDEGKLAAHISSPHVVQTLDLGRADDDSLYLVMELVVGVSLAALIRAVLRSKSQLSPAVAVEILSQAAAGLHDAHEARTMYGQPLEIVHRDISPQNILVDVAGRVRITDFGVARALERATHTQSGEVKGKIGYFAPEQVRGKNVDRRTDIFAMGICAWETIAGQRLFQGDNPAQTLDMVMSMPVPRLDELRPEVPREVADAIAKALERDQSARFQTAGEFAETLRYAMRPAGAKGVADLVRSHGGESLMKLEEGLRVRSPTSASRVRRAEQGRDPNDPTSSPSRAGRTSIPQVASPTPPAPSPVVTESLPLGAPSPFGDVAIEVEPPRNTTRWVFVGVGAMAVVTTLAGVAWGVMSFGAGPNSDTGVTSTPLPPGAVAVPTASPTQPATDLPVAGLPADIATPPTEVQHAAEATPRDHVEGRTPNHRPDRTRPPEHPVVLPTNDRPATMEAVPEPVVTMRAEVVTEMREPEQPATPMTTTTTMMGGLVGFDEFEDELQ